MKRYGQYPLQFQQFGAAAFGLPYGTVNPSTGDEWWQRLFANGEGGFLYYPALASNLFQDAAGTVPVTVSNDPVGYWKDESPNLDNGLQNVNNSYRPLYVANSGKPYLQPDAVDDRLLSTLVPNASPGLTLAIACRITSVNQISVGGGVTTGDKRAYLGVSGIGAANFAWGTGVASAISGDIRGQDVVLLMTGDGTGRSGYLNGVDQTLSAASGAPDGTGGAVSVGAFNNNGTPTGFMGGRIYAVIALNRRVTSAEIAIITSRFQGTYQ